MSEYIKARDNYEIDVLANPFGSPSDLDSDNEYFSQDTQFHEDKLPYPPAVYYHGGDEKGELAPMPHFIGMTIKRWVDGAGVWYRVKLDETSEYAKRVWEAAKQGLARVSSGAVLASVRKEAGKITSWMNGEISIFDIENGKIPANPKAIAMPAKALKKLYEDHNIPYPEEFLKAEGTGSGDDRQSDEVKQEKSRDNEVKMSDQITLESIEEMLDKREKEKSEKAASEKATQDKLQKALDEAKEEGRKEAEKAAQNRLPNNEGQFNINANYDPDMAKYDHMEIGDHALMVGFMGKLEKTEDVHWNAEKAMKSLARKIESSENKDNYSKSALNHAFQKAGVQKSDELNYSTQASYGDEWVTVAYSNTLWNSIRNEPKVLGKIPQVEIPQGTESLKFMLESGDPTFYKVAQATGTNATTGVPDATITASKLGTDNQDLSVAKLGARTIFTGELEEDSIIPFMSELRMQMQKRGGEILEHVIIDGDTATAGTTNINDIAGTPAGTEAFMVANGLRKLALVTNTANSRSAGGSLTSADFLETAKLLGTAGKHALDKSKVGFIIDANTHWAALQLEDVKTKDVSVRPTIEAGELTSIWGYDVYTSPFMHLAQTSLLANSAGKIDLDTAGNNAYGAILAVRYDQWRFGWKRRMTLETVRDADSDSYRLVAMMRFGLVYRDTEASAISYYVGV